MRMVIKLFIMRLVLNVEKYLKKVIYGNIDFRN